jgi:hypothetical protein
MKFIRTNKAIISLIIFAITLGYFYFPNPTATWIPDPAEFGIVDENGKFNMTISLFIYIYLLHSKNWKSNFKNSAYITKHILIASVFASYLIYTFFASEYAYNIFIYTAILTAVVWIYDFFYIILFVEKIFQSKNK